MDLAARRVASYSSTAGDTLEAGEYGDEAYSDSLLLPPRESEQENSPASWTRRFWSDNGSTVATRSRFGGGSLLAVCVFVLIAVLGFSTNSLSLLTGTSSSSGTATVATKSGSILKLATETTTDSTEESGGPGPPGPAPGPAPVLITPVPTNAPPVITPVPTNGGPPTVPTTSKPTSIAADYIEYSFTQRYATGTPVVNSGFTYVAADTKDLRNIVGFASPSLYYSTSTGVSWTSVVTLDNTEETIPCVYMSWDGKNITAISNLANVWTYNYFPGTSTLTFNAVSDKVANNAGACVDIAGSKKNANMQLAIMGSGTSLYASTDGGDTWTERTGFPDGNFAYLACSVTCQYVFAAQTSSTYDYIYYSDDYGVSWDALTNDKGTTQYKFYGLATSYKGDAVFALAGSSTSSTNQVVISMSVPDATWPADAEFRTSPGTYNGNWMSLTVDAGGCKICIGANAGTYAQWCSPDSGANWNVATDPTFPTTSSAYKYIWWDNLQLSEDGYSLLAHGQSSGNNRLWTARTNARPMCYQPTAAPTLAPTHDPSSRPTLQPTAAQTVPPTFTPSALPTESPTFQPSEHPTLKPSFAPSEQPTDRPTEDPTWKPTSGPSRPLKPDRPTSEPSEQPTHAPSSPPTDEPTEQPTERPSFKPSEKPSASPSAHPTTAPSAEPSQAPTDSPTAEPSYDPTAEPTTLPTALVSTHPLSPSLSLSISPLARGSSFRLHMQNSPCNLGFFFKLKSLLQPFFFSNSLFFSLPPTCSLPTSPRQFPRTDPRRCPRTTPRSLLRRSLPTIPRRRTRPSTSPPGTHHQSPRSSRQESHLRRRRLSLRTSPPLGPRTRRRRSLQRSRRRNLQRSPRRRQPGGPPTAPRSSRLLCPRSCPPRSPQSSPRQSPRLNPAQSLQLYRAPGRHVRPPTSPAMFPPMSPRPSPATRQAISRPRNQARSRRASLATLLRLQPCCPP